VLTTMSCHAFLLSGAAWFYPLTSMSSLTDGNLLKGADDHLDYTLSYQNRKNRFECVDVQFRHLVVGSERIEIALFRYSASGKLKCLDRETFDSQFEKALVD
jgi:hypothetical protein